MDRRCGECKYCRESIYGSCVCLIARKLAVTKDTPACADFVYNNNYQEGDNSD